MTFIKGKQIQVSQTLKSGCKDFVIREETRVKTFVLFMLPETARKLMVVCEDLLMKPHLRRKKWDFVEEGRTFSLEVTSNWRGNSLTINSITKTPKVWKRRIFIPEGNSGEGWLSVSRQIKKLICHEKNLEVSLPLATAVIVKERKQEQLLIEEIEETESAWLSIPAQYLGQDRFGNWAFAVICKAKSKSVDWGMLQSRIAEIFGEAFALSPFDNTNAIIRTNSLEEQARLCNKNLDDSELFSLIPWHPRFNGFPNRGYPIGGWIGVTGLPFHLWREDMYADIGKLFGGLLGFDDRDLSVVKLKIGGSVAWIPGRLDIEEWDEVFQVEIGLIPDSDLPDSVSPTIAESPASDDEPRMMRFDEGQMAEASRQTDNVSLVSGHVSVGSETLPLVSISNSNSNSSGPHVLKERASYVDALTKGVSASPRAESSSSRTITDPVMVSGAPPRGLDQGLGNKQKFKRTRYTGRPTGVWGQWSNDSTLRSATKNDDREEKWNSRNKDQWRILNNLTKNSDDVSNIADFAKEIFGCDVDGDFLAHMGKIVSRGKEFDLNSTPISPAA